ncbi:MAG: DUF4230 domain-containing protein [Clostridiales bacterium]|nr:DUF4230 domain-containing protein [Clostridiales bacterium]
MICLALAFGVMRFGPAVYTRLFGEGNTRWISERLSETLREKNELVVYEIEMTGQETVSQEAWLLGTVQKVEMPYTFQMRFTVDLSRSVVSAEDGTVEIRVPSPVPGYQKLTVDEDNMRKYDWLYPLTPQRYAAIKQELEDRLFEEYSANDQYRQNAWNRTVYNLESLFSTVTKESILGAGCQVRVVEDSTLNATAQEQAA